MPKVIIAFDADDSVIGKTVALDDDAARVAVREGRARYVNDEDAAVSTAPTDVPPMFRPEPAAAVPPGVAGETS